MHGKEHYIAQNFSMGRVVSERRFYAYSRDEAVASATRLLPSKNGQGQGGKPAAVVGVRLV